MKNLNKRLEVAEYVATLHKGKIYILLNHRSLLRTKQKVLNPVCKTIFKKDILKLPKGSKNN